MANEIKNSSNKFFAYIRVSTRKQEDGASLDEQLRQIHNYADNKKYGILNLDRSLDLLQDLSDITQHSNSITKNYNPNY